MQSSITDFRNGSLINDTHQMVLNACFDCDGVCRFSVLKSSGRRSVIFAFGRSEKIAANMDDEVVEKLTGLVPEAWFDLIARVIPGAIILVVTTQNTTISNVTIGGFAIGVLLAYVIGMVFDLCSSVFFEWVFAACAKVAPNSFTSSVRIWEAIDTLPMNSRGLLVKMMAEGIMFRSLFSCNRSQNWSFLNW
jgi:hypothetical protein